MDRKESAVPDGFSPAQREQLDLAKQQGVSDSECRLHPEWGPMLMNLCWNRERRGEDTGCVRAMADWLGRKLPKKGGVLYDDLFVLTELYGFFRRDDVPPDPPVGADGSFDREAYLFQLERDKLLADGSPLLDSGRVSVNGASVIGLERIMGEGIPECGRIMSDLQSWAAYMWEREPKIREKGANPMDAVSERMFSMSAILLGLDDMNIRGYQIPYALEYADGSIETLYGLIRARDQAMCRYVNIKSAHDYLAGNPDHGQLAVPHGASFCYGDKRLWQTDRLVLNLTRTAAEAAPHLDMERLAVDWSKLDVAASMDLDQMLRICGARGFELVRRVDRPDRYGEGRTVSSIVLYNKKTSDYVSARTCLPENACYGGASLVIRRDVLEKDRVRVFNWGCSCGPNRDDHGMYFEFTQGGGLFRHYDESMAFLPKADFDWGRIGFSHGGIPIPTYFELPFVRRDDLIRKLAGSSRAMMDDSWQYSFNLAVNRILCLYDGELAASASPHYGLYRDWLLDKGLFDAAGFWMCGQDCAQAVRVCNAVFTWLKVPEDIVRELTAGFGGCLARYNMDEPEEGLRFSNDAPEGRAAMEAFDLPDPEDLPVALPWLANMETKGVAGHDA